MKKILLLIVFTLLINNNVYAMSEAYEQEIYSGCYLDSVKSLGADRGEQYCTCTVKMLSTKYTDEQMDILSQKNEESYLQAFSFATTHCNNNAIAF